MYVSYVVDKKGQTGMGVDVDMIRTGAKRICMIWMMHG